MQRWDTLVIKLKDLFGVEMLYDVTTSFVAIRDGHVEVQSHKIEIFFRVADELESFVPVDGCGHFHASHFKYYFQHLKLHRIVVCDEAS